MPDTSSAWHSYDIGPHDSVFALGVASSNYARLEFVSAVCAHVLGFSYEVVQVFLSKTNNDVRLAVLKEALNARNWQQDWKDHVSHFIRAFEILAENRNNLMHSALTPGVKDQTALYKSSRARGYTISAQVTLTKLRQVADDMNTYFNYGLSIVNVLGIKALGHRPISGTIYEWPAKPPLPTKLEYKSHHTRTRGVR